MGIKINDLKDNPNIYLWGLGKYVETVFQALMLSKCNLLGVIDQKAASINQWKGLYPIYKIEDIPRGSFDYIVISIKNHSVLYSDMVQYHIDRNRLIFFWDEGQEEDIIRLQFINYDRYMSALLQENVRYLKQQVCVLNCKLENYPYELGLYQIPMIQSAESLLEKIKIEKVSLCRFGDGEFEMIRMKKRPCFQNPVLSLSKRLRDILASCGERICVAVADNFGSLDKYTERSANDIRFYMSKETRKDIHNLLGYERQYYDAYVSRPYMMYKDKTHASKIFELYKQIFAHRDILLVEGSGTRNGVGNDLFSSSRSIRRIICPDKNAFSKYEEIRTAAKKYAQKTDLILITLGPTATVLAYDMAIDGYQALDYGQVDNEYEWYKMGVEERCAIPGKMVSELSYCPGLSELEDEEYNEQIVCRIR